MNPLSLIDLNVKCASLLVDAHTVMTLRLMEMAGFLPAHEGENNRMVTEKVPAMMKSYAAGTSAALSGHFPDQIMSAALMPISHKVRANRKRLME